MDDPFVRPIDRGSRLARRFAVCVCGYLVYCEQDKVLGRPGPKDASDERQRAPIAQDGDFEVHGSSFSAAEPSVVPHIDPLPLACGAQRSSPPLS